MTGKVSSWLTGGDAGNTGFRNDLLGMFQDGTARKITVVFNQAQSPTDVGNPPYGLFVVRGNETGSHAVNNQSTLYEQHIPGQDVSDRFFESIKGGQAKIMTFLTTAGIIKNFVDREDGQVDVAKEKDGVAFDVRLTPQQRDKVKSEGMYAMTYDANGDIVKLPVAFKTLDSNRSLIKNGSVMNNISSDIKTMLKSGNLNPDNFGDAGNSAENKSDVPGFLQNQGSM
jgi:hypothetical protein